MPAALKEKRDLGRQARGFCFLSRVALESRERVPGYIDQNGHLGFAAVKVK
jgi:hypothetical protein